MRKMIPLLAIALLMFGVITFAPKAEARGVAVARVGGHGIGGRGFNNHVRAFGNAFRGHVGFNRRNIGLFGGFGFRNHNAFFNNNRVLFSNYLSVNSAYCSSAAYAAPSFVQSSYVQPSFAPAEVAPCPAVVAVAPAVVAVQAVAVVPYVQTCASFGAAYVSPFVSTYGAFNHAFGFNHFGFRGFGFGGFHGHGHGVRAVGRRF